MVFKKTKLKGVFILEPEKLKDARGFFARSYCKKEFAARGLDSRLAQCNISFNKRKGALRGMHFQAFPHEEAKLVRCTRGAIYDVVIDLRPRSRTFKKWIAVRLTAENHRMLYVPPGFAHGFQTLKENSEVFYQMSEFYHAPSGRGIRWNDPAFKIKWPLSKPILSKRDKGYQNFEA